MSIKERTEGRSYTAIICSIANGTLDGTLNTTFRLSRAMKLRL